MGTVPASPQIFSSKVVVATKRIENGAGQVGAERCRLVSTWRSKRLVRENGLAELQSRVRESISNSEILIMTTSLYDDASIALPRDTRNFCVADTRWCGPALPSRIVRLTQVERQSCRSSMRPSADRSS